MKLENNLIFTGTQVNYFLVCARKLWFFSKGFNMEQTSDLVYFGQVLDNESYQRELKNIIIDGRIQIDFFKKTLEVHEVKKSKKLEKPHLYQLLYYLYYLKQKGVIVKGVINYPLLRKKEIIELTTEREKEVERILKSISEILSKDKPPTVKQKTYCKKCSYYQLCYA
ncbi:CRISPR-associated protein Cas4 [Candidatus Parcubacteria bacterium]|nr:CRISPR-associated protein Cas4 [Candidatus Parcubacteria bacterium]